MRLAEPAESKFKELRKLLDANIMAVKICADDDKSDCLELFKFDEITKEEKASLVKSNKAEHSITTYLGMDKWSACDYLHLNCAKGKGFIVVMIEETSLLQSFKKVDATMLIKKRIGKEDIKKIIKEEIGEFNTELTEDTVRKIFFKSNYAKALAGQLDEILKEELEGRADKNKILETIVDRIDVKLVENSLLQENKLKMESSLLLLYILRDQEDFKDIFTRPAQHYFLIYHSPSKDEKSDYGSAEASRVLGIKFKEFTKNIADGMNQMLKSRKVKSDNTKGGINLFFGGVLNGHTDLKEFISNPHEMPK